MPGLKLFFVKTCIVSTLKYSIGRSAEGFDLPIFEPLPVRLENRVNLIYTTQH